jgi:hypothetical protein
MDTSECLKYFFEDCEMGRLERVALPEKPAPREPAALTDLASLVLRGAGRPKPVLAAEASPPSYVDYNIPFTMAISSMNWSLVKTLRKRGASQERPEFFRCLLATANRATRAGVLRM